MKEKRKPFTFYPAPHPWEGTQHCLRQHEPLGEGTCVNDHTGCLYNDGNNGCGAPFKLPAEENFDSPLLKKSTPPDSTGVTGSQAKATGDCFEAAAHFAWTLSSMSKASGVVFHDGDLIHIVHAEVDCRHRPDVPPHGHAYVTVRSGKYPDFAMAFDLSNGQKVMLPVATYERLGHIDEIGNVHRYTLEEANRKMLEHGHYGPWDLVTSTGL